jgi:hypothetical protein
MSCGILQSNPESLILQFSSHAFKILDITLYNWSASWKDQSEVSFDLLPISHQRYHAHLGLTRFLKVLFRVQYNDR